MASRKIIMIIGGVLLNSNAISSSTELETERQRAQLNFERCQVIQSQDNVFDSYAFAYSTGDCFLRAAQEIMAYVEENGSPDLNSNNDILTALQYADSWFRLAEVRNEVGAEDRLRETQAYIAYYAKPQYTVR